MRPSQDEIDEMRALRDAPGCGWTMCGQKSCPQCCPTPGGEWPSDPYMEIEALRRDVEYLKDRAREDVAEIERLKRDLSDAYSANPGASRAWSRLVECLAAPLPPDVRGDEPPLLRSLVTACHTETASAEGRNAVICALEMAIEAAQQEASAAHSGPFQA